MLRTVVQISGRWRGSSTTPQASAVSSISADAAKPTSGVDAVAKFQYEPLLNQPASFTRSPQLVQLSPTSSRPQECGGHVGKSHRTFDRTTPSIRQDEDNWTKSAENRFDKIFEQALAAVAAAAIGSSCRGTAHGARRPWLPSKNLSGTVHMSGKVGWSAAPLAKRHHVYEETR